MTERPLTNEEMVRAAQFLFGSAEQNAPVTLPPTTARAIARAILGALNVAA